MAEILQEIRELKEIIKKQYGIAYDVKESSDGLTDVPNINKAEPGSPDSWQVRSVVKQMLG